MATEEEEIKYETHDGGGHITVLEETVVEEGVVVESLETELIEGTEILEADVTEEFLLYERFTPQAAIDVLMTLPEEKCLSTPPQNPMHGDWYIFSYLNELENKRGWQKDGYFWRNYGLRKDKYDRRVLHKRYFRQHTDDNHTQTLSRIVYECIGVQQAKQRYLIQYIDDSLLPKDTSISLSVSAIGKKKGGKKSKGTSSSDSNSSKIMSGLTVSHACKMLMTQTNTVSTVVPEGTPECGFWYIYNYSFDLTQAEAWLTDGFDWHLEETENVPITGGWMVKRHFVRVIGDVLVDFHRYSYEFLPPDIDSEYGENYDIDLPSQEEEEDEEEVVVPRKGRSSRHSKPSKENTTSAPSASVGSKRRTSWKWSPAKGNKNKKLKSTDDISGKKSSVTSKKDAVILPLYRVLIHYLGDFYQSDEIMETVPVPVCRAVPLHCYDGTLKTAEIGPNKGIHRRLTTREADRLIRTVPSDLCNNYMMHEMSPRAGLWHMVEYSELCDQSNEWSQDTFMWQLQSHSRHSSYQGFLLHKRYRRIVQGELAHLYRSVYTLVKNGNFSRVLVHYIGLEDEPESDMLDEEQRSNEKFIDFDGFSGYDSWELLDNQLVDDSVTVLNRDGLSIMVETKQLQPFELDIAAHLIENTLEEDCLTFAPSQPLQGQWYIFSYLALHQFQYHAWRRDGIKWRHNGTFKKSVGDNKYLSIKNYRKVIGTRGLNFTRLTYELTDEANEHLAKRVLVHYYEGESQPVASSGSYSSNFTARKPSSTVSVRVSDTEEGKSYTIRCHKFVPDLDLGFGNQKTNTGAPGVDDSSIRKAVASILNQEELGEIDADYVLDSDTVAKLSKTDSSKSLLSSGFDSSNNFYYEEVVTTTGDGSLPSQSVQELSQRYIADEEADTSVDSGMPYAYRVDRDIVTSLHEFLFKIKDSHQIFFQLIPTTISILACKHGIVEFKSLMSDPQARHLVYYDKTWRIGGLHVTSLYSRHDHCERENLFPIAIIIHELDDLQTHEVILEKLSIYCECLNSPDLMLINDASPCVVDACKLIIPDTKRASSWVNIFEAVKMWFTKQMRKEEQLEKTLSGIKQLLDTATMGEYNALYEEVSATWPTEFKQFYEEYLTDVVYDSNTGNLLSISMYSKDGIATEGSREFLMQMEFLFANSEVAYIDALAHLAYYMLYYYRNESEKGKVCTSGILFRRKPNIPGKLVKKKNGFFPSWCAVPTDVAGAILHKMRVGQPIVKNEPTSVVVEFSEGEQYKELCNIEIDLDDSIMANAMTIKEEVIEMFTEDEVEENVIELSEGIISQNGDEFVIMEEVSDDDPSPVIKKRKIKKIKSGLRLASHSLLFGDEETKTTRRTKRQRLAERRRKLKGNKKMSYELHTETYIVDDGSGQSSAVRVTPRRACSCSKNDKNCRHVMSTVLETMQGSKIKSEGCEIAVTTISNADEENTSGNISCEAQIGGDSVDWYEGEEIDAVTEIEFVEYQ